MTEAEFELWQDGAPSMRVSAPLPEAARMILRSATISGQYGPVEIKRVTRETMTPEQVAVLAFNEWEPKP